MFNTLLKIYSGLKRWFRNAYLNDYQSSPRELILYVTSTCNQKCSHCFYSAELNQPDDLSFADYQTISENCKVIEAILIGGGEPFTRRDLPEILNLFYKNNNTRRFGIPTNCTLYSRMNESLTKLIKLCPNAKFGINVSLDGLEETHNKIRRYPNAFNKSVENLEKLISDFKNNPNISFSITSTLMKKNIKDVFGLENFIKHKFKSVVGISWNYLRDINKSFKDILPPISSLVQITAKNIEPSNKDSFFNKMYRRAINELRLQNIEKNKQALPCVGGTQMGVIYANGDVSSCEMLPVVANIKTYGNFKKAWNSPSRLTQRKDILLNKCVCTHECFLGPSIMGSKFMPIVFPLLAMKNYFRELKSKNNEK